VFQIGFSKKRKIRDFGLFLEFAIFPPRAVPGSFGWTLVRAAASVGGVLALHPEKSDLFWLSAVSCIYTNIQRRVKITFQNIFYLISIFTRIGTQPRGQHN
jgi:hypothetical protein